MAPALLSAAGLVVALNLLLRATNVLQQTALAYVFGPGPELDAYATAVSLPNLLIGLLILGPLGLALTPILAAATSGPERERAWRIASAMLSLVAVTSIPVVLVGILLAPALVRILAPGLAPGTASQAAALLQVLLPAVGCAAVAAVLRSILHGLRWFAVPVLAYLGSGLLLLGATLGLGPLWGIEVLAWATLAGAALGLAGQGWVLARQGAHLRFLLDLGLPELRPLATLLASASVAMAATQLFSVWDRLVASYLGPGQIALLDFTLNGDKLVAGTLALSIAAVGYPDLAAARREGHPGQAAEQMLRRVALVALPATVTLVVLREPGLRLWLQHGQFRPEAARMVGDTLLFLTPALLAWAFILPLMLIFHALGRMQAAAGLALLGLLANAGTASAGAAWGGLPGLAAGTSLAALLTAAALGWSLAWQVAGFPARSLLGSLVPLGFATAAGGFLAGIALWLLDASGLPTGMLFDLIRMALGAAAFAGGFAIVSRLLPSPELRSLLAALRKT